MTPTPVSAIRGDTWKRTWTIKDYTSAPINLTGCTARLHVRSANDSLVASASTSDGRIILTPLEGKLAMTIPASVMRTLPPADYNADIEVTFPDGTVKTYERIILTILKDASYD